MELLLTVFGLWFSSLLCYKDRGDTLLLFASLYNISETSYYLYRFFDLETKFGVNGAWSLSNYSASCIFLMDI